MHAVVDHLLQQNVQYCNSSIHNFLNTESSRRILIARFGQ